MHLRFIFLLLGSLGLSNCSAPSAEAPPTAPPRPKQVHSASGTSVNSGYGPNPDHRSVRPENVRDEDTAYVATLPVLDDVDGTIRIRVAVNPQAHTLEKTSVLFTPHQSTVTYRQIGLGVGAYDAKTGHYYFNTAYQKVRQLVDGRTDNGSLQEINGWVHPGATAAAVMHEGAFVDK